MILQFEISKNFDLDVHEITFMKLKWPNIWKISLLNLSTSVRKSDGTGILKYFFPALLGTIDRQKLYIFTIWHNILVYTCIVIWSPQLRINIFITSYNYFSWVSVQTLGSLLANLKYTITHHTHSAVCYIPRPYSSDNCKFYFWPASHPPSIVLLVTVSLTALIPRVRQYNICLSGLAYFT